jgi:hypothetical protein
MGQLHAQALVTLAVTFPAQTIAAQASGSIRPVCPGNPGPTIMTATSFVLDQPGCGTVIQVLGFELVFATVLADRRGSKDLDSMVGTSQ